MKAGPDANSPAGPAAPTPEPGSPSFTGTGITEVDLSLLLDSLSKTPWERMQANDDALRFAELLRNAMEKQHAKPERTDETTG